MKKILLCLMVLVWTAAMISCDAEVPENLQAEPQITQMRSICELAVMECYYHNVAKYDVENAERGFLGIGRKDKRFWIEYSGVVKLGIDASLVEIEVSDGEVTVFLPEAKVLGCRVDAASLNDDSFIVDKDSAKITAEDEIQAFQEAQAYMENTAAEDRILLEEARQRVVILLEEYIQNIGSMTGMQYSITWAEAENT